MGSRGKSCCGSRVKYRAAPKGYNQRVNSACNTLSAHAALWVASCAPPLGGGAVAPRRGSARS
eukprot:6639469-Alexandrium_andersonii.AAC.1